MIISRFVTPSGGGGVYVNDQAQLQYNRDLTERLAFTGAVICIKSQSTPLQHERSRPQLYANRRQVKWMIRPTWFVQGGYQYAWQKYTLARTARRTIEFTSR